MTQLYQSKIFAYGSTALQKPVRDALGIKAGDRVCYFISDGGVQIFKVPTEKDHVDDAALREALDAAEVVMDVVIGQSVEGLHICLFQITIDSDMISSGSLQLVKLLWTLRTLGLAL